tara:strand:+ start:6037 stop:7902 length:1866 start_codon:yes stop_codon:yes gene_type:complete
MLTILLNTNIGLSPLLDDFLHPKSGFTHGHFLMYVFIISSVVLIYYIFPWIKVFVEDHFLYKNREKIIVIGQSRMSRSFAKDAANKGKKIILISTKEQNNFTDELKVKGIKLILTKEINESKLKLAGINHATSCIVASDDDEYNISMANLIGLYKKTIGGKKLKLIVSIKNASTRNLLIDQINSFNSTPYVAMRFYDIDQSVARHIYDQFSPNRYVDDSTLTNNTKAICIVGYNEIAENFLIENCVLSQFPENKKLKIFLVCKNAQQRVESFIKKYPGLIDFISIYSIELHSSSFSTLSNSSFSTKYVSLSSKYEWDQKFIENIPNIDAVYIYGDQDAIIVSKALGFRQFLYAHTKNIRRVPIIANLAENTSISSLLAQEGNKGDNLFRKYKENLHIHFVRTYFDTCTYQNIIDDNEIELLAKVINYYYSIKYEFDSLLNKNFKKMDNKKLISKIEQKLMSFKIKKQDPHHQIEAMVINELQAYTNNSIFKLTETFGIEQRWENVTERAKESNRYVARHLPSKLLILGKLGIKEFNIENINYHLESLAPLEHNRWAAEKIMAGFNYGEVPRNDKKIKSILKNTLKIHDQLIRYDMLDTVNRDKDMDIFLIIPLLIKVKDNL